MIVWEDSDVIYSDHYRSERTSNDYAATAETLKKAMDVLLSGNADSFIDFL